MQLKPISSCAAAFLLACAPTAHAGPFADKATEAETLVATDPVAAVDAARAAFAAFMETVPLRIVNATFVVEKASGYGMYEPRDPVFAQGEQLIVYAEPVGIKWTSGGRGHVAGFVVDVDVLSADGAVLGGQKNFGDFTFDMASTPSTSIHANLSLSLTGLPPGGYKVRYTFTDRTSSEQTFTELPFEIR